jgi:hypothetical protein
VLSALDERNVSAPIAYEDVFGGIGNLYPSADPLRWKEGSSALMSILSAEPISTAAKAKLRSWAARNQLLFSFHYYPGTMVYDKALAPTVALARAQADDHGGEGGMPLWCSEFGSLGPPAASARAGQALTAAQLAENGVAAATYWHLANITWTRTEGTRRTG